MPVCGKSAADNACSAVFPPHIPRVCITRSATTIQPIDLNNFDAVDSLHRLNGFQLPQAAPAIMPV